MAKFTGLGAKFFIGTSAEPPVYTEVAQVSSIGSIDITSDEVEVTTLDNTSGFREFLTTFKDAGELPITVVWDPALPTHGATGDGMWGLLNSQQVRPMKIEWATLPVPYEATFDGFVKSFPTPAATPDDALTADVTIRVSGTVTLTAGTLMAAEGPVPAGRYLPAQEPRRPGARGD